MCPSQLNELHIYQTIHGVNIVNIVYNVNLYAMLVCWFKQYVLYMYILVKIGLAELQMNCNPRLTHPI